MGAYTEDGTFIGQDFMPISPKLKTIKVLAQANGESGYLKWNLQKINEIQKIAKSVEEYSEEPVEYVDMRNPNDVYVKIKSTKIRLGKIDGAVYERIERIPSIIPQIKLINKNVEYLDISWEKVNYLKLISK